MDSNWPKYIKRAIRKHFSAVAGDLEFHMAGEQRAREESEKKLELFVNGPNIAEGTKGYFFLLSNVRAVITIINQYSNIYSLDEYKGQIANAFDVTMVF